MPATPVLDPLMTSPPRSPYTPAIVAGDYIFLSGQTGRDPATQVAGETIEKQAEQAMTNMRRVLEAAGASLSQVVSVTIFLAHREDMQGLNEVYRRHFSEPYPARATVAVELGRPDSLIEMQVVAYTGD